MKFRRERSHVHWLVQDLYVRETWGQPYYRAPQRRFDLRRFFIVAMIVFGLVDAALATLWVGGSLLAPGMPTKVARPLRAATRPATRVSQPVTTPVASPTSRSPLARPTPVPTRVVTPTSRPTRAPQPTRAQVQTPRRSVSTAPTQIALAAPANNLAPARTLNVDLPPTLHPLTLAVNIPAEPLDCTPAERMPEVVTFSIKLCPGQVYRPFVVRGQDIGIFGHPEATIQVEGRRFGIVVEGAHIFLQNLVIRATTDPADAATLLCLYPDCRGRPGGVAYGGGILVRALETTIMDSTVSGGVAGIAAERVTGLKLIHNRLDNSTGWGSYNFAVNESFFVGNSWSNNNRSCTTAEGQYLPTGCESAGWLCIACQRNIIARNTCSNSGDCYYMNGEGGLASNHNRFHQNQCRAAPHNCYEVTFSMGNEFVENIAEGDPLTGAACQYPFWVGGSWVIFARNQWKCAISAEKALQEASDSTHVPTRIEYQ